MYKYVRKYVCVCAPVLLVCVFVCVCARLFDWLLVFFARMFVCVRSFVCLIGCLFVSWFAWLTDSVCLLVS